LINNHYAVYTKQSIPVARMTGGEFWTQAGVPFGVNDSSLDSTVAFDPTEGRWYATAINVSSDGVTWSQGTDLRIAVSRGDDPTEGFIGFNIHLHNVQDAGGEAPILGYNRSGVFIASADYPPDFSFPTGFTLVVLPKSDLLARKPRVDRRTVFRNIPISSAGEWIAPAIDLDGSKQDEIVLWYPSINTALVKVNGQIWMVTTTIDNGTGRGSIQPRCTSKTEHGRRWAIPCAGGKRRSTRSLRRGPQIPRKLLASAVGPLS
jgi:hypothetical protein